MFHKIRKFINKYQSMYTFRAFVRDFYRLRRQLTSSNRPGFQMKWRDRYPILNERTEEMPFDSHYIYFTAWAIRKVLEINPAHHVDISSKLYFSTNLSAIISVNDLMIRTSRRADFFSEMEASTPILLAIGKIKFGVSHKFTLICN